MTQRVILNVAAVSLIVACAVAPAMAWGKKSGSTDTLVVKGTVVAKTATTLAVAPSRTEAATQMVVMTWTEVTGQRRSFTEVAVGDFVTIQGRRSGTIVVAEQIEVVARAGARFNPTLPSGSATTVSVDGGLSIGLGGDLDLKLPGLK